jgi:hypothetical protein
MRKSWLRKKQSSSCDGYDFLMVQKMKTRTLVRQLTFLSLVGLASSTFGCGGNGTSGRSGEFSDTEYVSDDSTGRLEVRPVEDTIPVGSFVGFEAFVFNSLDQPVPDIQIVCDTEGDLRLIEPTTGVFMTGDNGGASGRIGCAGPGSFTLGCRLGAGGNRRDFAHVKCVGDVPPDFTGFPGSGGGGLGGGVTDPDDGGPGEPSASDQVRIVEVSVSTLGGEDEDTVPEIDTTAGACGDATAPTPEPFGDDEINITIRNSFSKFVRFTGFRYVVKRGRADGSDYRSSLLRFAGVAAPADPETSIVLQGKIFDALISGRKAYSDGVTPIPSNLGVRNVEITVVGVDADGEPVETTAAVAMSFDNFNYCS